MEDVPSVPRVRQEYLATVESDEELAAIRQCTHTGRPLGTPEFIHSLGRATQRDLAARKGGRPGKPMCDPSQTVLTFHQ